MASRKRAAVRPVGRPAIAAGIPEKVVDALLDATGVDEIAITRESRLVEDLGADSLDVVEIAIDLEERYQVEITDQDLDAWTLGTVGTVLATLENRGAKL